MKQRQLSMAPTMEDLLSDDPRQRNRALRALYDHPTVRPKVASWLQQYDRVRLQADDIIQEAIILLFDMILEGRFREESKLVTFLLGICRNLIRNNGKKVNRIDLVSELPDHSTEWDDSADQAIVLAEATVAENQRDDLLRKAIGQLKDNCQETLTLFYYKEYSMARIAEIRGLKNANQAKKLADRCRQYLRRIIQDEPRLENFLRTNRS